MKVTVIYVAMFSAIVLLVASLIIKNKSPEKIILGKWEEISFEYEKVDKNTHNIDVANVITESIRNEVVKDLIIHEAEKWEFLSNGKLKLFKKDKSTSTLNWSLKGRGHILKIKHPENILEFYDLYALDDDTMVLYFDVDLQVRGIVKMTFKRTNVNRI